MGSSVVNMGMVMDSSHSRLTRFPAGDSNLSASEDLGGVAVGGLGTEVGTPESANGEEEETLWGAESSEDVSLAFIIVHDLLR